MWDTKQFKGGRLSLFAKNWEKLLNRFNYPDKDWILNMLKNGLDTTQFLKHDFSTRSEVVQNAKICSLHEDFVTEQVDKWLLQSVIEATPISEIGVASIENGLTVALDEFGSPKRLCLHTLFVNNSCRDLVMKLPNVPEFAAMVRPGYLMAKFDLKSGFLQILLKLCNRRLYRFRWRGKLYQFLVMPWGAKYATAVFQRLQDAVVFVLRSLNICCVNYIDDLAICFDSVGPGQPLRSQNTINFTVNLLTSLGYFLSIQKCTFSPQLEMVFLGIGISPALRAYFITEEKNLKLRRLAATIASETHLTVKAVQKWAGFLNSLSLVLPHTRFWLSPFFASINGKKEQDIIPVTPLIRESAMHWIKRDYNKRYLHWCSQSAETLQVLVFYSEEGAWSVRNLWSRTQRWQFLKLASTSEFVDWIKTNKRTEATWVHLFTDDSNLLALSHAKFNNVDLMPLRVLLDDCHGLKLTFHKPPISRMEMVLTPMAARRIDQLTKGKISVDLMGTVKHNFGFYVNRDIPYHAWAEQGIVDFFALRAVHHDCAYIFPPEKMMELVLSHLFQHHTGRIHLLFFKPKFLPSFWPVISNAATEIQTIGLKCERDLLEKSINGVTQQKIRLPDDLMLATLILF